MLVQRVLIAAAFTLCGMHITACTTSRAAVPNGDLLGLLVNEPRPAAEQRLNEIGKLERTESGRQEIWMLIDDTRFSSVAVGFDKKGRVRYITAFVDKTKAKDRIAFSSVGDISKAKSVVLPPHYRYIWEIKGPNDALSYLVNVYGDDPDYLTMYTLSRFGPSDNDGENDDD